MQTANQWYETVSRTFAAAGNAERAAGQSRYMKHKFVYFGLKMPEWMAITNGFFKNLGLPPISILDDLVELCFEDDHREMQYFAIESVQRHLKKQAATYINHLEWLITTKSWWDSVDWIAKLVGMFFQRHPQLIQPVTERWMSSGNIWLQRVSIIFQLSYKDKTDTDLMFQYILRVAESKEFFLRKGAGWALRQHSRIDGVLVRSFVEANAERLSGLTKREALRLIGG
jgi:3-methyladenine DNA glycosylase AlkD